MNDEPALNTDREIWREREGDYYADSIFVTKDGSIGINCGGFVVVQTVRAWHALAAQQNSPSGDFGEQSKEDNRSMPRGYFELVAGILQECQNVIGETTSNFDDDMALAITQTDTALKQSPSPLGGLSEDEVRNEWNATTTSGEFVGWFRLPQAAKQDILALARAIEAATIERIKKK